MNINELNYEQSQVYSARQNAFIVYVNSGDEEGAKKILRGDGDLFAAVQSALLSYSDGFYLGFLIGSTQDKTND